MPLVVSNLQLDVSDPLARLPGLCCLAPLGHASAKGRPNGSEGSRRIRSSTGEGGGRDQANAGGRQRFVQHLSVHQQGCSAMLRATAGVSTSLCLASDSSPTPSKYQLADLLQVPRPPDRAAQLALGGHDPGVLLRTFVYKRRARAHARPERGPLRL